MRSFVFIAFSGAFVVFVAGQLTLDTFNSRLGEAAEEAGIPACGVPCLNDGFSFFKASRACFVNSGNLECLCDNPDIEGSLRFCGDKACGAADSMAFQYWVRKICENGASSASSTSLSTSASGSATSASYTSTTAATNAPTTSPSSSEPSTSQDTAATPKTNGGFSRGAIAGIAAGASSLALAALLLVFLLLRRRRRNKNAAPLEIILARPLSSKGEKAELMGSPAMTPAMTDGASSFTITPRSELGLGQFEDYKRTGAVDGQRHNGIGCTAGLGDNEPVELDGSEEYHGNGQPSAASMASTPQINLQGGYGSPLSGPLPSASELYPSPQLRGL